MSDYTNLKPRYITNEPTPAQIDALDDDQREVFDDLTGADSDCAECDAYNFVIDLSGGECGAYFALRHDLGWSPAEAWRALEDGEVTYVCERDFCGSLDHNNEEACDTIGRALIESFGSPAELGKDILERYFDYAAWARDVMLEGYQDFIEGANGGVYEVQL